jgi:hypothetical protein
MNSRKELGKLPCFLAPDILGKLWYQQSVFLGAGSEDNPIPHTPRRDAK